MKNIYALTLCMFFGVSMLFAQGNSGKAKNKKENKSNQVYKSKGNSKKSPEVLVTNNNNPGKFSKNQPTNVTSAFQRDYPYAKNVTWSKYKGDWTATFGNGIYRSTAVYHANGARKDTRTVINRNDLPGNGTIWDRIFSRNKLQTSNIIRIEQPENSSLIYRMLTTAGSALFFNNQGEVVNYDY